MRALGWYTVAAALATLALAAGFAVTRAAPRGRAPPDWRGRSRWSRRAWRGEWWYATDDRLQSGASSRVCSLGWVVAAGGSWVLPALLVVTARAVVPRPGRADAHRSATQRGAVADAGRGRARRDVGTSADPP